MRIIGGEHRGRPLTAPRGPRTRPTSDMLREAVFSSLFDVEGYAVLDLFAGTGAVGLEALSRGAAHATFVEFARPALAALTANLTALSVDEARCAVRRERVSKALAALLGAEDRFDLIYADPPYDLAQSVLPEVLAAAVELLTVDGTVIVEHRSKDPTPEAPDGLVRTRVRRYGEATIGVFERSD